MTQNKFVTKMLVFDKANKQRDYRCMARRKDNGKWIIGWISIYQPWYSPKDQWTYYMTINEYREGSICGGAENLGFKQFEVDPETIMPFNQKAEVLDALEDNLAVRIVKDMCFPNPDADDNTVAYIEPGDELPDIWD